MYIAVHYYKTEINGPRYLKNKVLHHSEKEVLKKPELDSNSISKTTAVSSKHFHHFEEVKLSNISLSCTTIRGTQIRVKAHHKSSTPLRKKSTKEDTQAKSPLAGPLASRVSRPARITASVEASHRGVSEHLRLARGLSPWGLGHETTPNSISDSPEPQRRHYPSPARPRPTSKAALPLVRSRPPMTSPTTSRPPNRTGRE
jgi:hypothetical protein